MIRCLFVLSLGGAAVLGQPASAQTFKTYHCDDGSEFVLALYQDSRTAYVQLDGKSLALKHRPAVVGSRYSGSGVSLHVTDKATTLRRGRLSTQCSAS